jgi:hypothetical protein
MFRSAKHQELQTGVPGAFPPWSKFVCKFKIIRYLMQVRSCFRPILPRIVGGGCCHTKHNKKIPLGQKNQLFILCSMQPWCTSEDECKWFTAIWFILLKQAKQGSEIFECGVTKHYYYLHTNGIVHSDYVLCAQWVSFVTPDSSSSLPTCSMRVLPPHLLLFNCLSCPLSGGQGPPPFPALGLTPFPSGSGHLPASSSATICWLLVSQTIECQV